MFGLLFWKSDVSFFSDGELKTKQKQKTADRLNGSVTMTTSHDDRNVSENVRKDGREAPPIDGSSKLLLMFVFFFSGLKYAASYLRHDTHTGLDSALKNKTSL